MEPEVKTGRSPPGQQTRSHHRRALRRTVFACLAIAPLAFTGLAHSQTSSGIVTAKSLEGRWKGVGYTCGDRDPRIPEIVDITSSGDELTVTKVSGDACVCSGEVTWRGAFHPGGAPITLPIRYRVAAGATTRMTDATATVYDDLIVVTANQERLSFAPERDDRR